MQFDVFEVNQHEYRKEITLGVRNRAGLTAY